MVSCTADADAYEPTGFRQELIKTPHSLQNINWHNTRPLPLSSNLAQLCCQARVLRQPVMAQHGAGAPVGGRAGRAVLAWPPGHALERAGIGQAEVGGGAVAAEAAAYG